MNYRVFLLSGAVLLVACQNMPQPYAPPVQRLPLENAPAHHISMMVNMSDPGVDRHAVQDIPGNSTGVWRWVGKKPTIRLKTRTNENLKYVMDFTIAEVTFKETGPVTISFYVNDHLLDTVHYEASGSQHFEKVIPKEWVQPGQDTTLAAEIDKVWTAPVDGAKLGFILTRIGIAQ